MKVNKTKLLGLLLMLACVFGLTACGSGETKTLKYDEQNIALQVRNAYLLVSNDYGQDVIDTFREFNDDEFEELADQIYESAGIKTEGTVFVKGVDSYQNALTELGTIDVTTLGEGMKFDPDVKELIVTMPLNGSVRVGELEVIFDRNLHITSITTNVKYNINESMQKAGQNTLIGMGTVFAMLILIMCIIYCFGIIPKLQKSKEDKKKASNIEKASVDNAIAGIVEREETSGTDDLELVAVISAAIAAYEGSSSTDGFVVRSIRRIR